MPMPSRSLRWSFVALLCGVLARGQQAVVAPADGPWVVKAWDTASGLPQNTVSAVLQAHDGMLWAATFGGLCRGDGVEWRVYDAEVGPNNVDSRIMALVEGQDHALWFGSELGFVWRRDDDGARPVVRLPRGRVVHMARWGDGRIAVGGADDVYLVDAAGSCTPLSSSPLPDTVGLLPLPGGEALVCGLQGIQRVSAAARTTVHDGAAWMLSRAADGAVWCATARGLMRWRDGVLEPLVEPLPADLRGVGVRAVLAARSGAIWFAAGTSLVCLEPDGARRATRFAAPSSAMCLHEDAAGGIWVGTPGAGLARLSPAEAEGVVLRAEDGRALSANVVLPRPPGGFLVGTSRGLFVVEGGRAVRDAAVPVRGIHSLWRDADGTLWLGLEHALGRLRDGVFSTYPLADRGTLRALLRDGAGRLLLGTEFGVHVFDGQIAPFAPAAALRDGWIKMLVPWRDGGLWIVGEHRLLQIDRDGRTVASLLRGKDVPLAEVRAVLPGQGERTWFATYGSGFVGWDARGVHLVGPRQGLPDAYLCNAVAVDGQLLVGGNRRPFVLDLADLDRVAAGERAELTGRLLACPGTISTEGNGGSQPSCVEQDGTVALCSVGGLWQIQASRLRRPMPPPICHLEPALNGDQTAARHGALRTVRAQRERTLVVHCTAPDFDAPESLAFCWRFADGEWSQPGRSRALSVTLPGPGPHALEFVAVGRDGVLSPRVARLAVHIEPFLVERAWFPWGIAALLALAGFGVFRFGSWQSARKATQLRELVAARTAELSQARDSLEQRVAQRTEQLQLALAQSRAQHAQRSQLERELEQMRRMESLGQLAGSVAHDFNNLLTVVLGNAQILECSSSGEAVDLAKRIVQAAKRGRELTQRLLAVASRQAVLPSVVDLGDVLRGQLGVLRDLMGAAVRVDVQVPPAPMYVRAAAGQLDQVLLNLAVNARAAMPNGGSLSLAAEPVGDTVRLTVADDGVGMAPEVQARVFEPFFTTRPEHGTGLGLATVYGIVKQLQGEVAVDSRPGRGTTFTVTLPLAPAPVAGLLAEPAPVELPRPAVGATGIRVLLVEDDREVRRALRLFLEACHCVVVAEADCGADAVRCLAEYMFAIDLIVSDVRMPGLQGVELVHALRAVRAGMPMLFVSGHTSSASLASELGPLGIELVGKPPTREELLPALARALRTGVRVVGKDAGS